MIHALGLDLGGSSIKYAMLVREGEQHTVVATGLREIHSDRDPATITEMLAQLARDLSAHIAPPSTIGVGVPGLHDERTGCTTLLPNFPSAWLGHPLRTELEARLDRFVVLGNDARAFALAEATLGAAAGYRTAVCVVLGTGVGGGIVIDGVLWRGQGTGGEVGHQTVELEGPPCGCGNRGCVEAIAGSAALLAGAGLSTVGEVFEAARLGDLRAQAAVDRAIRAVGAGLANCYAVLAPDVFVIGGGIAEAGDQVLVPLQAEIGRRMRLVDPERVILVRASLGRYAGAVGAALMGATLG